MDGELAEGDVDETMGRANRTQDPNDRTFGSLLRQHRLAVGFSQEQLAERAGLSVDAISTLERGVRRSPYLDTLRSLADALALSADDRAALETAVRRGRRSAGRANPPGLAAVPNAPGGLIGRDGDSAAVLALLQSPNVRLLTLTGPPGVGKTRLALAVADAARAEFSDGAAFVDLAPIRDPGLVAGTIARALGLRPKGSTADENLRGFLRDRDFLLILDNFEQIRAAAPLLADLLSATPGLTILVTSRAALRLRWEHVYRLGPLDVPDGTQRATRDPANLTAAEQLFVDRARARLPSFEIAAGNAATVAEICARLGGLPLAIELAAAWISTLPETEILARLRRGIDLLRQGPGDLPPRHASLRAALAWSYDLLPEAARRAFPSLAVFAGGWTLDGAAEIAAEIDDAAVLEATQALVDHCLIRRDDADGRARYRMLEPVREYALEQLRARGDEATVRRRHATRFLRLAGQADARWYEPDEAIWLQLLRHDYDNLRAALAWSLEADAELALDLAGQLEHFWEISGQLAEGQHWIEAALARGKGAPDGRRAKSLSALGTMAWRLGDFSRAEACHAEALRLYRALGDDAGVALALNNLGVQANEQCRPERAALLFEESLSAARRGAAGEVEEMALSNLGVAALNQRDYGRARLLLADSVATSRRRGHHRILLSALENLAEVCFHQGDLGPATAQFQECLRYGSHLEARITQAYCLEGLAEIAVARSHWERAARLFGAAEALRERINCPLPPAQRALGYDASVAALHRHGDPAAVTAAWAAGRVEPLGQAVALALQEDGAPPAHAPCDCPRGIPVCEGTPSHENTRYNCE